MKILKCSSRIVWNLEFISRPCDFCLWTGAQTNDLTDFTWGYSSMSPPNRIKQVTNSLTVIIVFATSKHPSTHFTSVLHHYYHIISPMNFSVAYFPSSSSFFPGLPSMKSPLIFLDMRLCWRMADLNRMNWYCVSMTLIQCGPLWFKWKKMGRMQTHTKYLSPGKANHSSYPIIATYLMMVLPPGAHMISSRSTLQV